MTRIRVFNLGLAIAVCALAASPAAAQFGSPVPQPQLSPYLYLNQGGQQGFFNYRQAIGQQELQRQVAPLTNPAVAGRDINRTTNFQSSPQTTGINASVSPTGHANSQGISASFMNFSHFYTVRPSATGRPY